MHLSSSAAHLCLDNVTHDTLLVKNDVTLQKDRSRLISSSRPCVKTFAVRMSIFPAQNRTSTCYHCCNVYSSIGVDKLKIKEKQYLEKYPTGEKNRSHREKRCIENAGWCLRLQVHACFGSDYRYRYMTEKEVSVQARENF